MNRGNALDGLFTRAYRMLGIKARSRGQIYAALIKNGADTDAAAFVVSELTKQGLLDDNAFSSELIAMQLERKPCGRRYMLARLLRAGVDSETALPVLQEVFSEEKEKVLAMTLVRRLKDKSDRTPLQILRHLKYRGFNENTCISVLKEEFDGCLDITP